MKPQWCVLLQEQLRKGFTKMAHLIAGGSTDVGRIRQGNEDSLLVHPDFGLLAVADGMGGHAAGEVASKAVIVALQRFWARTDNDTNLHMPLRPVLSGPQDLVMMDMALRWINQQVWELAQSSLKSKGMGSTAVVLRFSSKANTVTIGHLGDSRCYRLRGDILVSLTEDHSVIQQYAKTTGKSIDELRAKGIPDNIITKACGLAVDIEPTVAMHAAKEGDTFLLCSDGLTNELTDEEIRDFLLFAVPRIGPTKTAEELVQAAVKAGGRDNITAVIGRIMPDSIEVSIL